MARSSVRAGSNCPRATLTASTCALHGGLAHPPRGGGASRIGRGPRRGLRDLEAVARYETLRVGSTEPSRASALGRGPITIGSPNAGEAQSPREEKLESFIHALVFPGRE